MRRFLLGLLPNAVRWWLIMRQIKRVAASMEQLARSGDEAAATIDGMGTAMQEARG